MAFAFAFLLAIAGMHAVDAGHGQATSADREAEAFAVFRLMASSYFVGACRRSSRARSDSWSDVGIASAVTGPVATYRSHHEQAAQSRRFETRPSRPIKQAWRLIFSGLSAAATVQILSGLLPVHLSLHCLKARAGGSVRAAPLPMPRGGPRLHDRTVRARVQRLPGLLRRWHRHRGNRAFRG
jgi:hypothetical protein